MRPQTSLGFLLCSRLGVICGEPLGLPVGKFSLLEVRIDTGRTHQIRVHLASLRHPVVGSTLYGAPKELKGKAGASISLARNFLHAAELRFLHPRSGEPLSFSRPLPAELAEFFVCIQG